MARDIFFADVSRVCFIFLRGLTLNIYIPHILLYPAHTALSLFTGTFSQKRVAHTKGVRSLSLGPRDYIPRFPRVPRVRDLLTSSPRMNSKSPTMCSKEKQKNITSRRPRRCARTPEIFSNHPSRGRSDLRVLSVIRIKEDERSLPRYHISKLAFGGLEHLHNLRRPCQHQRRAPVVTRLVHISSTGKQDSNMRGSIAPARGEERSQPILVRGIDLE